MVNQWDVRLHRQAVSEAELIRRAGLEPQVKALIQLLREDPSRNPPPYEKLVGDLKGLYSRRINRQHRLVYSVEQESRVVKVLSIWSHYERL